MKKLLFLFLITNHSSLISQIQFERAIGGTGLDYAYSIKRTTDGGYVTAGGTTSFGNGDFYIIKLDANGTLQWSRTVGGIQDDYCLSIVQTTGGGFAVAGPSSSFGAGNNDFYIVKLDTGGALQWTRTVGGTGLDYAESVIQTTDGGYAVGGLTYSFGAGGEDMYIVKLNGSGTLQWSRTVGGPNDDYAESIVQTTDGGYAAAGHTNSYGAGNFDAYIVKFDAGGNTCRDTTTPPSMSGSGGILGSPASTVTSPVSTVTSPTSSTGTIAAVTNICTTVGVITQQNETPHEYKLEQNYPNPFNSKSKIKYQISKIGGVKLLVFDMLGREIDILVNEELKPGIYEVEWDASNYPSAVYFYKFIAEDFAQTRKMILLK